MGVWPALSASVSLSVKWRSEYLYCRAPVTNKQHTSPLVQAQHGSLCLWPSLTQAQAAASTGSVWYAAAYRPLTHGHSRGQEHTVKTKRSRSTAQPPNEDPEWWLLISKGRRCLPASSRSGWGWCGGLMKGAPGNQAGSGITAHLICGLWQIVWPHWFDRTETIIINHWVHWLVSSENPRRINWHCCVLTVSTTAAVIIPRERSYWIDFFNLQL